MNKILIILIGASIPLFMTGCGLAKIDEQQNADLVVIVEAHNATIKYIDQIKEATKEALATKSAKERFEAALKATPTPTPSTSK